MNKLTKLVNERKVKLVRRRFDATISTTLNNFYMTKVQALNFKPRLDNIDRILQDLVFSLDHIKQNMDELYKYHPNNPHKKDVVSDYSKMRNLYFQTEMEIDHYSTVYNILEKEAKIILN